MARGNPGRGLSLFPGPCSFLEKRGQGNVRAEMSALEHERLFVFSQEENNSVTGAVVSRTQLSPKQGTRALPLPCKPWRLLPSDELFAPGENKGQNGRQR